MLKYIKIENNQPINYTLEQLFIDFPNAIIYKKTKLPNEELIKEFNVSDIIQSSLIYVEEIETDTELSAFFVDTEVREARYDICKACTSFTALKTCNECHCIMPLKTKLRDAVCPLGKW